MARARTEAPAVERLVEHLERNRWHFRSVLCSTISDLLTVLNMARRDGNGDEGQTRTRAEGRVREALVPLAAAGGDAAPRTSLDEERTSGIDPVERLQAMLRGIDSALGEIPALPRE